MTRLVLLLVLVNEMEKPKTYKNVACYKKWRQGICLLDSLLRFFPTCVRPRDTFGRLLAPAAWNNQLTRGWMHFDAVKPSSRERLVGVAMWLRGVGPPLCFPHALQVSPQALLGVPLTPKPSAHTRLSHQRQHPRNELDGPSDLCVGRPTSFVVNGESPACWAFAPPLCR